MAAGGSSLDRHSPTPWTPGGGRQADRRFSPDSGRSVQRPPDAANRNLATAARIAAILARGLRVGAKLHPLLRLIDLMLMAYQLSQRNLVDQHPVTLSYAGFELVQICNYPTDTGPPHKRGGPGTCLVGQGSPGPKFARDPISGAEWNNGFTLWGLITTLPFERWNQREGYAPIWQTTGIWSDVPETWKGELPDLPPWIDPGLNPPFMHEPVAVPPPLFWVRARGLGGNVRREESERGEPKTERETLPIEYLSPDLPRIVVAVPDRNPQPTPWKAPDRRPQEPPIHEPDEWPELLPPPALPGMPVQPVHWPLLRPQPARRPGSKPKKEEAPKLVAGQVEITSAGERIRPSLHRRRQPKRRRKEKKVIVSATRTLAARAFSAATETLDALDSVYKALPEYIRKREAAKRHGKEPKAMDKLGLINRHWDELDEVAAVENLIANQFEDWFYGQLNRKAQAGINASGWQRPVGIQAGNVLGHRTEGFSAPRSPVQDVGDLIGRMLVRAAQHSFGARASRPRVWRADAAPLREPKYRWRLK